MDTVLWLAPATRSELNQDVGSRRGVGAASNRCLRAFSWGNGRPRLHRHRVAEETQEAFEIDIVEWAAPEQSLFMLRHTMHWLIRTAE